MIRWVDSAEGTTLLDLRESRYCRLNATGSMIWSELIEENSIDKIVEIVMAKYRISAPKAQQDVTTFINKLVDLRYLGQVTEAGGGVDDKDRATELNAES